MEYRLFSINILEQQQEENTFLLPEKHCVVWAQIFFSREALNFLIALFMSSPV